MLVTDKNIDLKQALNYHQIMKFPITNRYYMQIFWLHIIMKRRPLSTACRRTTFFAKEACKTVLFFFKTVSGLSFMLTIGLDKQKF